ncbi:MAG: hypothetical protein ACK517_05295, partial [bacterium]
MNEDQPSSSSGKNSSCDNGGRRLSGVNSLNRTRRKEPQHWQRDWGEASTPCAVKLDATASALRFDDSDKVEPEPKAAPPSTLNSLTTQHRKCPSSLDLSGRVAAFARSTVTSCDWSVTKIA